MARLSLTAAARARIIDATASLESPRFTVIAGASATLVEINQRRGIECRKGRQQSFHVRDVTLDRRHGNALPVDREEL